MKVIGTKKAHVEAKTFVEKIICDICKKESRDGYGWDSSEVKIEGLLGSTYPEADCRTLYLIDVCSDCFTDKIKPLIEKTYEVEFREIDSEERYSKHE